MIRHKTSYSEFIKGISSEFTSSLTGGWRKRSIGLLSLLFGYYLASSLSAYYLQRTGQRVIIVPIIIIFIELLVRLRRLIRQPIVSYWLSIDNIRIGITYAIVLEAFKLGS